jgi:hypothetical protein
LRGNPVRTVFPCKRGCVHALPFPEPLIALSFVARKLDISSAIVTLRRGCRLAMCDDEIPLSN